MVRMTRAAVPAIPYRRCWINSEKLRPDNVATAGNERGKGVSPLHMACREEERDRIYQTSIRPFRKATYTHFLNISTRDCVITAHAMALSVMTEEFTMRGLAYNPGILPAEMIIRQRVKPMPSREELLKRNSFPSVNQNKYLNAMLRSGKK